MTIKIVTSIWVHLHLLIKKEKKLYYSTKFKRPTMYSFTEGKNTNRMNPF